MSSRVLEADGKAAEARPILWRSAEPPSATAWTPTAARGGAATETHWKPSGAEARLQDAYQRGLAEGEATAAQRAGAMAAPVLENFGRIVSDLVAARKEVRSEAEEPMVRLAIAIARRILHREISTDPLAVLGIVRAGLDRLNAREIHRLRLAPPDAEVARDNWDDLQLPPQVEIVADPALPPGSAVFETARGEMEASVSSQLAEIERGFADIVARRKS